MTPLSVRGRQALLIAALLSASCKASPGTTSGGEAAAPPAVQEGKQLFESGQLDAALAKLQEAPTDPEGLYYQARVWAKKAVTAPLPTPPPPPDPLPKGWEPPAAPEFKQEEIEAARLYEQAIAARPDLHQAHLGLAELLAPHAARAHDLAQEAATKAAEARKGVKQPSPFATAPPPVDASVDRVVRAYQTAVEGDESLTSLEGLLRFARRVGRLDAEETGLRELVRRVKERPDPLVRYGDFLVDHKKDPEGAIEQYRQALMWKLDDEVTRAKIADIYLKMAANQYNQQHFAMAEVRLKEAEKYISDRTSPQGRLLQDYQARLGSIRRPAGR